MRRTHRSAAALFLVCGMLFLSFSEIARAQVAAGVQTAELQAADKAREAEKQQHDLDEGHWKEYCGGKTASGGKPIFLTGPATGYYSKVGNAIAHVLSDKKALPGQPSLQMEPAETNQTGCNLLGLETGGAAFGMVQSDVAHDAWFGHPPVRRVPLQGVSLVAPLYVEAVHIVVRPHLNLAHLTDLKGRRVWLGTNHSLTVFTAKRILDAAGLTPEQVADLEKCEKKEGKNDCPAKPITEMTSDDALEALKNLQLDAMFQVGPVPFDVLRDKIVPSDNAGHLLDAERQKHPCEAVRQARATDPTLRDSELHLFNLDLDLVDRLVADGSYIEQLIPADAYCQSDATLTVGVRALLLTNKEPSDASVSQIAKAIFANQRDIETKLRQLVEQEQLEHHDVVTGEPSKLPLLRVETPGALYARYHETIKGDKVYFDSWKIPWRRALIWALAALLGLAALYWWRGPVGRAMANHGNWPLAVFVFLCAWVGIAAWMKHYEGSVNEDFSTLPSAMLSTVLNLLGFGKDPITQNGQILWHWGAWLTRLIFFGLLLPDLRRLVKPGWWMRFRKWLGNLDVKRATALADLAGSSAVGKGTDTTHGVPPARPAATT